MNSPLSLTRGAFNSPAKTTAAAAALLCSSLKSEGASGSVSKTEVTSAAEAHSPATATAAALSRKSVELETERSEVPAPVKSRPAEEEAGEAETAFDKDETSARSVTSSAPQSSPGPAFPVAASAKLGTCVRSLPPAQTSPASPEDPSGAATGKAVETTEAAAAALLPRGRRRR